MAITVALLNRLWSRVDRNPVGNLGFSHFSADALVPALLVGSAEQVDHLQAIRVLAMIDILIDGLVVNIVPRMVDLYPTGYLLRGPSLNETVFYILPDEIVLKPLMCIGLGLSFTRPGMGPAGHIPSTFRGRVSRKFSGYCAFVSTKGFGDLSEATSF